MTRRLLIVLTFMLTCASVMMAQGKATHPKAKHDVTRLLIVLDCSNTMGERWQSDSKIKVTQQVLLRFLDSVENSTGTELLMWRDGQAVHNLRNKIKSIVPGSERSVIDDLRSSPNVFAGLPEGRNIVWVITDDAGKEKELCDIARQLQLRSEIVQTFILCIDNKGNGTDLSDGASQVFHLHNEEAFDEALFRLQQLSESRALITLGMVDADGVRYATDVPVVFCDHTTHAVKYATHYHYGVDHNVDTLVVDPLPTYDITFFTKPPITVEHRHFGGGKHQSVLIDAQQGGLSLSMAKKRVTWSLPDYPVLIRKHGDCELVAKQTINTTGVFLEGEYDVEVLTLPPTRIEQVKVLPNATTDLQIAWPGQLALTKPKETTQGILFALEDNRLTHVCNLDPTLITESLVLMPGQYEVVLHPQNATKYDKVQTKRFVIESSQTTKIQF